MVIKLVQVRDYGSGDKDGEKQMNLGYFFLDKVGQDWALDQMLEWKVRRGIKENLKKNLG